MSELQTVTIDYIPNPGSDEALNLGCICPVLDNCHGRGLGDNGEKHGWVYRMDCPVHVFKKEEYE